MFLQKGGVCQVSQSVCRLSYTADKLWRVKRGREAPAGSKNPVDGLNVCATYLAAGRSHFGGADVRQSVFNVKSPGPTFGGHRICQRNVDGVVSQRDV